MSKRKSNKQAVRENGREADDVQRLEVIFILEIARGDRYSLIIERLTGRNVIQFPYGQLESRLENALDRVEVGTRIGFAYRDSDLDSKRRRTALAEFLRRYDFEARGEFRRNGCVGTLYTTGIRLIGRKVR